MKPDPDHTAARLRCRSIRGYRSACRSAELAVLLSALGVLAGAEPQRLADSPYVPKVSSRSELDAFRAIEIETRPAARGALIRAFLDSFPDSQLRYLVLRHRWRAAVELGSGPEEIIDAASDGIDATHEFLGRLDTGGPRDAAHALAELELHELELAYYRSMVTASRRLGDLERIAEYTVGAVASEDAAWSAYARVFSSDSDPYHRRWLAHNAIQIGLLRDAMVEFRGAGELGGVVRFGERILEFEPDDLLTLMVLAVAMSEVQPEQIGAPENLSEALDYAARAIQLLADGSEAPDLPIRSPNRGVLVSSMESTRGWILYQQGRYEAAEEALLRGLEGADPALVHYRLGLTYSAREQWAPALTAFARALSVGEDGTETVREARIEFERAYEREYGSNEGLSEFLSNRVDGSGGEEGVD